MSIDKYNFVSPGIQTREIDNSQLPQQAGEDIGPVVIGRSKKGPSGIPVKVNDFEEFVNVFGEPDTGTNGGDIWRTNALTAPTYGPYAAQAWLRNNQPLTFIRLLGEQSDDADGAISTSKAGWETDKSPSATESTNGGAYGLFLADDVSPVTGTLAAKFYLQEGSIVLSGSNRDGTQVTGSAEFIQSVSDGKEFKAIIFDANGTEVENKSFNFNSSSDKYIRKVFNTNPALTNSSIVENDQLKTYWLGETFERSVSENVTGSTAGDQIGVILGLENDGNSAANFRYEQQAAKTGWFFSQDLSDNTGSFEPRNLQKLFRLHALDGGNWDSRNLKISIQDIKQSPAGDEGYGTFTVAIRSSDDSDQSPQIVEQYTNVNLNPDSPNYIASKIGDKYMKWDDSKKSYQQYGFYDNQSQYVRVEVASPVKDAMINPAYLPFGVYGPLRHKSFTLTSGSATVKAFGDVGTDFTGSLALGQGSIPRNEGNTEFVDAGTTDITASFLFPEVPLRSKATDITLSDQNDTYFGIDTGKTSTSTKFYDGYSDLVRPLSVGYKDESEGELLEYSWVFTLDDLSGSSVTNTFSGPPEYVSGSRKSGTSISAVSVDGWVELLDQGHNKFTTTLHGGFDGLDITEKEPFRNSKIISTPTEQTDHVYYTLKRAIDSIRDPEVIEHNLAVVPGLVNEGLTTHLARTCEKRRDSGAIIDPEGGFTPRSENTSNIQTRIGNVSNMRSNMRSRSLNSSYAFSYAPWVYIADSSKGTRIPVPPSVVALGVMAYNDTNAAPWFAPAGFNRGGLSEGNSGLQVVGATKKLLKDDRDSLYEVGINPIASFPNEGLVVYGQKTLLTDDERSALNRINVRRMVIFVKKQISRLARQVLFENNVRATWNNFKSLAKPFLDDVQSEFGITNYKLILDESTTTPDLIDRNIMAAKIILVPARTIENIALEFAIENSGASFLD